jgi:hypothetical protein
MRKLFATLIMCLIGTSGAFTTTLPSLYGQYGAQATYGYTPQPVAQPWYSAYNTAHHSQPPTHLSSHPPPWGLYYGLPGFYGRGYGFYDGESLGLYKRRSRAFI